MYRAKKPPKKKKSSSSAIIAGDNCAVVPISHDLSNFVSDPAGRTPVGTETPSWVIRNEPIGDSGLTQPSALVEVEDDRELQESRPEALASPVKGKLNLVSFLMLILITLLAVYLLVVGTSADARLKWQSKFDSWWAENPHPAVLLAEDGYLPAPKLEIAEISPSENSVAVDERIQENPMLVEALVPEVESFGYVPISIEQPGVVEIQGDVLPSQFGAQSLSAADNGLIQSASSGTDEYSQKLSGFRSLIDVRSTALSRGLQALGVSL